MKPCKNDYKQELEPECLGGFGELCNKTQYHNQNRVYSSFTVSVAIATAFHPWYLVKDEKDLECSN